MADEGEEEEEAAKVREVARTKTGLELFRELLRHYMHADIEDYFRNGVWRNDRLKADIVLIAAHRRAAGAPDPVPLEEVPEPKMPLSFSGMAAIAAAKGLPAMTGTNAAAGTAVAELRATALFCAKWKLDAMKTRAVLSELPPERRRQIMATFRTDFVDGGSEAFDEFELYVKSFEESSEDAAAMPIGSGVSPAGNLGGFSKAPPMGGGGMLAPAVSSSAATEMRLLTLFATRFKLDLPRTKALLVAMPAHRRTHIMQTFSTTLVGPEATDALEQYILDTAANGGIEASLNPLKRPLSGAVLEENGERRFIPAADMKMPPAPAADVKRLALGSDVKRAPVPFVVPPKHPSAP